MVAVLPSLELVQLDGMAERFRQLLLRIDVLV
jgi:hypothetical protein